jgi:uncharacterized OsmC-like protein
MDSMELRNLQAPLKEKYKTEPGAALITLKARGSIGAGITCKVDTGRQIAEAGLHPATGGDGSSLCSGDMLLEALVACAGVTLNAVATAIELDIRDAELLAEGDLDFRGTLGVEKNIPVGFQKIRLHVQIKTDAGPEQVETLMKLTERYCVVYQTLKGGIDIAHFHTIIKP